MSYLLSLTGGINEYQPGAGHNSATLPAETATWTRPSKANRSADTPSGTALDTPPRSGTVLDNAQYAAVLRSR
ncbi:hypothetical protein RRG08_034330 [Elysia crispata]|uniref:Uncharacterized protein n=1 Tax=Elysia crispata TaxID=231223 RepID=A0AAE1AGT5_9GAST|nr:hypothetical protein RRG08_034330 [Elysia crispata]